MNLIIADDHPLFREALVHLFNKLFQRVEIKQADDFVALQTLLEQDASWPDCLFLDLNMPGGDTFQQIEDISSRYIDLPVVVITGSESAEDQRLALQKGARGFLSKSLDSQELEKALLVALTSHLSPDVLTAAIPGDQLSENSRPLSEKLTKRQLDVYQLICQGDTNKMIANKLDLTEGTVKLHVRAILQALGVKNRTQAVAINREGRA